MATAIDTTDKGALALPGNDPAYVTMSSREIAELTEKRHDHVLRDIETMLAALGETSPQFWGELPDSYGRPQRVAVLPKRETLILVSGYNIALRARIIDRLEALEAAAAAPRELTRMEILTMALDSERRALAAEALASERAILIEQAKPKTDFYDAVVNRDTLVNATAIGQKFGMSAIKLNRILEELTVYHKGVQRQRAFRQWFLDKHFGIMRETDSGHPQAMFTKAGEAWIVAKLISEGYGPAQRPLLPA